MTDSPVMWGDGRFEEKEGRILAMGRWGNDFEMCGGGGRGETPLRTMLFSDIDMDCFVLNGGIPFCFTWI